MKPELTMYTDPFFVAPVLEPPEPEQPKITKWQDIPLFAELKTNPTFQSEIWVLCDILTEREHLSFQNDEQPIYKAKTEMINGILQDFSFHWFGNENELSKYYAEIAIFKGTN